MGKNFTSVFALCLAISAIPLACGGDDDDDGGDGDGSTGGKGGSAGSTSTGGKGGTAGSTSTGGKGGTAGSTSTGGKGGTAGTAGIGGAEGGVGGAEGGMGGAGGDDGGGDVDPANCQAFCSNADSLNCTNELNCVATCVGQYEAASDRATCDPLFDARYVCQAAEDIAAFACDASGNAGYAYYSGYDCDAQEDALIDASCI